MGFQGELQGTGQFGDGLEQDGDALDQAGDASGREMRRNR